MAANKNVCLRWPRGARDSINAALLCSLYYCCRLRDMLHVLFLPLPLPLPLPLCVVCVSCTSGRFADLKSFLPFTVRATVDSLPLVIVVITRHRHHHHHRGVGRQRHIALPALTYTGAHGRTRLIFFPPFHFIRRGLRSIH